MNGKQLKNSILQWAIQGKLVPQDPNDEPASVLLEKIRAEKARLVKEGKLKKKDLEVKSIAEDEIPFEIPKGWEWCRIGDLFNHSSGKQQSSSNNGKGTPQEFITTSNLYWGRFVLDNVKVMNFTDEEIVTCSATKGDLLVCEGGAGYGRSAIWDKDYDICLQNHVHRLRPCISGVCEYVYHFLYLLKESNQLAPVGTAMPGLSANRLKDLILPLPPLAEQHRILVKIEELMPLVEKYGAVQEALDEWNQALPEKLKKSILQEAIQGKLVPQDLADESASALLERIREEKKRLVKEGKLKKKDLEVKPIEEDEIPFEIPKGWEWCRLKEIVFNHGQKVPDKEFSYIDIGSIDNKKQKLNEKETLIEAKEAPSRARRIVCFNDIVYSTVRPYLHNMAIINKTFVAEPIASTGFAVLSCHEGVFNKYLFYYLMSPSFDEYANNGDNAKGVAYPAINDEKLYKALVPLPPLAEQCRIVAKIEELFGVIKK